MSGYFEALIHAVDSAGLHRPVLVLDQARLTANLAYLRANLPGGMAVRLADKSLPVPDLLAQGFKALGSDRVMSFHLPLTARVLDHFPKVSALMGKPMPVAGAAQFLKTCPHAARVTWLIDSDDRLMAYRRLAEETGTNLRIAFEVNIGLGRGGLETPDALRACLTQSGPLHVEGVMGYEAHVNALPRLLGGGAPAQGRALERLAAFVACLGPAQRSILNTGGSSTALGLPQDGPANDLTLGSLMVKPSDFDQHLNAAIDPALFIVTPALKTYAHGLPGHPRLSRVLQATRLIRDRIVFFYGGKWMARPVFPEGLTPSPFFDASSNQHGMCLPRGAAAPGHIVLRPTQSEAVLQQFGDIQVFDGTAITGQMTPFPIL
ncbi:alanine racemase [Shimia sediminis]|uniref:alanine racemase n=1 Tax=Shimia sediminis TaxID=2497945 RepID=UPI000F8E4589|nr:alanine racemase [Shimia sediminis]